MPRGPGRSCPCWVPFCWPWPPAAHPWCTWLWGLVLGNLGIRLCIAFQVPAFLVNLRHLGYGRLSAGGGFGVWVLTFHTRRTLLLASPLVLALLTALARDRKA